MFGVQLKSGECRVSKYEHRGLNTVHVIMLIYCTAGQYSVTAPPPAALVPAAVAADGRQRSQGLRQKSPRVRRD